MIRLYKYYSLFLLASLVSASAFASTSVEDRCSGLAGTWTGTGSVNFIVMSCNYNATVKIGEGNPADASLSVTKSSGSFLCPKKVDYDVTAACDNGIVTIKDEKIDASGEVSDDKKSMSFTGVIRVLISRFNVSLELTR